MTNDYTPSLNEVRADYVAIHTRNFDSYATGRSLTSEQEFYASQFDRWLTAQDADVAERITLSTTGDLDALPDGSVVLDGRGRVSQKFSSRWHRSGAAEGGRTPERVLRYGSVALLWPTPTDAVEVEWEWHLRDESGDIWTGPFASEEQAQAARRESRPHWIVVRRRRAGPWVEVPPVAATGEGDGRG